MAIQHLASSVDDMWVNIYRVDDICFHLGGTVNNMDINTCVNKFFCVNVSFPWGYIPNRGTTLG